MSETNIIGKSDNNDEEVSSVVERRKAGQKFQYEGGYIEYHKAVKAANPTVDGRKSRWAGRRIDPLPGLYCMTCHTRSENLSGLIMKKDDFFCPDDDSQLVRIRVRPRRV